MSEPREDGAPFAVVWFDPDGYWTREAGGLDAETAVHLARDLTLRPAAELGMIARVIITDSDDCTCFEWRRGLGVTFK